MTRTGRAFWASRLRDIRAPHLETRHLPPAAGATVNKALAIGGRIIPHEKKLGNALWPLLDEWRAAGSLTGRQLLEKLGAKPGTIDLAGKKLTPEQVERQSATVNASVYLASRRFWDPFLPRLQNKNAQREFYLTDVINLAVADGGKWKLASTSWTTRPR